MPRFLEFLRTDDLPFLTRRNYRYEIEHILLWGAVVGAVEGNIASVIAAKTFNASQLLITVVWAIPVVINVLNVFWGAVLRGRPRIPAYVTLVAAAAFTIGTVALTPRGFAYAGWLFAAQVAAANFFLSGIVTLRSTVWRSNYPQSHRAVISGRVSTARMIIELITAALLGMLFDHNPDYYAPAFLVISIIGGLAILPLRKIRVRGESAELRRVTARIAEDRAGAPENGKRPRFPSIVESFGILKHDALFRRFMVAQFLLGSANFFVGPILIELVDRRLGYGYFQSALLLVLVPTCFRLAAIRKWSPLFDRVGAVQFRVANTQVWLWTYGLLFIGVLLVDQPFATAIVIGIFLISVSRILHGIGHGGGQIAWNLGHLHFAPEHQTELYMGVHVALTGLRGLIMPLIGLVLYAYIGSYSFLVAFFISLASYLSFRSVARDDSRTATEAEAHAGEISAATARTGVT
ncbi:MAG: hypothetical protein AB7N71_02380 [Phycisphaerae bacterium]